MRHLLKPLAAALCGAFLSFAATAKTFDQVGPAPSQMEAVGTYAAGSPVRSSLKALVPKDWQIMVHRGVQLPATMDWSAGETWPQVLSNFAEKNGFAVLVDWDKNSVFFRPSDVALEDAVKRTQVAQASVTPLPSTVVAAPTHSVPNILTSAQPPVPSVDRATVDAMATKLASLEIEMNKLADAKAKGQVDTAAALEVMRKELDARGAALVTAQSELESARRTADEARRVADSASVSANQAQTAMAAVARDNAEAVAKAERAAATAQAERSAAIAAVAVAEAGRTAAAASAAESARVAAAASEAERVARANADRVAVAASAAAAAAVKPQEVVAAQGGAMPSVAAGDYRSMTIGQGFNRAPVFDVASKVAELHGATLIYSAPLDLRFPGAVTILGADMGEDVRLMLRALGPDTQVSFDLCRNPAYLRVVPAIAGSAQKYSEAACSHPAMHMVAANAPVAPVAVAYAPSTAPVEMTMAQPVVGAHAHIAMPSATAMPMTPAVGVVPAASVEMAAVAPVSSQPTGMRFSLEAGADLERGLREFLNAQGYSLRWDSQFEYAATDPLNAEGKDLVEVLTQFLPKMGLEAEINTQERIVRVADKRNEVTN